MSTHVTSTPKRKPNILDLLGAMARRGRENIRKFFHLDGQRSAATPAPDKPKSRAEELGGQLSEIAEDTGKRSAENQIRQIRDAKSERAEAESQQEEAMGGFDAADDAADKMVRRTQAVTQTARQSIESLPDEVKKEFEGQEARLEEAISSAKDMISWQRGDALNRVMQGQAQAMAAAVGQFHNESRKQMSEIDAMVQQGQLSPSQARMMKSQVGLQSAMDIAPAIGQTIHMFRETEAQVATSFGNMFTQIASTGVQATGQLGAAAGTAFAQSNTVVAQLNTQLAGIDAQAESQRASLYSTNAAQRAQAQAINDTSRLAFMDFTADRYTELEQTRLNYFEMTQRTGQIMIRSEQMDQYMVVMKEMQALERMMMPFKIFTGVIEALS